MSKTSLSNQLARAQHESNRHDQLHRGRLVIQINRLVFPFFQCLQGSRVEKRWAGNHLHLYNVAVLVQHGIYRVPCGKYRVKE